MKFIRPTPITPAMLVSSNVPETDYPVWVAGTYAVGDRRIVVAQHKIYQCAVAGSSAVSPELDPTRWAVVGATNRWSMFDNKTSTITSNTDSISITLAPGRFNSLALFNINANAVNVSLSVDGSVVYEKSTNLVSRVRVGNWYEYFYEPFYQQDAVVLTDLVDAALIDLPAYTNGQLTVTLSRPGGTVSCGALIVGMSFLVGKTRREPSVSIRDFSIKSADAYGNYTLKEGEYSKKMSANVLVDSPRVDEVVRNVARYRATNLVWIGSPTYGVLVVWGFATDWKMVIENRRTSEFLLEVEGM